MLPQVVEVALRHLYLQEVEERPCRRPSEAEEEEEGRTRQLAELEEELGDARLASEEVPEDEPLRCH